MFRTWIILSLLFGLAYGTAVAHAAIENAPNAYQLTQNEVELAVAAELRAKGAGEKLQAQLTGQKSQVFYQGAQAVQPRITGLAFDKNNNRWSANLIVALGDKILSAHPLGGRYQEMVSLPTLKRQVRAGETIASADIEMLDFPYSRTRSDVIADAGKLVGNSPRGAISPKRPVREQEIASPAVIRKNDVVSMRYTSGNMQISTTGIALSHGAKGDVIQLRNANSKSMVSAVVDDARNVNIINHGRELAGDLYVGAR